MLKTLFTAMPEATLVVDAAGVIRLANRRAEELFAYAPDALIGRSVDTLVPAAMTGGHARHRSDFAADPRTRPMGENLDLRGRRADGTEFPIDVALGPAEFEGERLVVAIVRDITDRKLRQDELRYLSDHDALTGLVNRRALDRELAKRLAHARRHGVQTTLMLLDLDGFKLVNDRLGHLEGDRLLCDLVRAIERRLRAGDTLARLGGDEFAIVLPYTSPAAAESIARELLGIVREVARETTRGAVDVTASIGVAPLADAAGVVIAAADAAMYEAKRAGGDTVLRAG
jgi:diguanylate cyclase (GGDEF)-like protein/PAS domain S-box-containing protein